MSRKAEDLTGQQFGRLVVLWDSGKRENNRSIIWACKCDCGNIATVPARSLKSGGVKSCGCLHAETARKQLFKHGGWGTRLYRIWQKMKSRCYYPRERSYKYYGNRGIQVCPEWENNFVAFRDWALANGYKDKLTIDRIDNNGNYEPLNCQWITRAENIRKSNKIRWDRYRLQLKLEAIYLEKEG